MQIIRKEPLLKLMGGYLMNNQKNMNAKQNMKSSQSNATSAVQQGQTTSAKQQASKSEYGTLTAKSDANNDYK